MGGEARRDDRPGVTLQPIRPKRLYQQIAEQISEMVRAEALQPGDRLPAELDLARRFGVSRPSVREALIVLEMAGLVEVRTGSGAYLREPSAGGWPSLPLALGPGPLEQFKARMLLEPELASEAARHATPDEIEALGAIVERTAVRIAAEPRVSRDHFLFHEKLALASGNTVLATFVRDLIALMQGPVWQTTRQRIDNAEELGKGLAARRQIVACLERRDARGAKAAMRAHLRRIGRLYFGEAVC